MKKLTVVHFSKDGVRILKGLEAARMASDPNCLVNPVFPKGVSPERWVRSGQQITSAEAPVAHKPSRVHWRSFLVGALSGALLALIIRSL